MALRFCPHGLANPEDCVTRLVYADWLDERDDPRAEFLRLQTLPEDTVCTELRERKRTLQSVLPSWWLAAIGGLQATPTEPDPTRIEVAALALARRSQYTTTFGYEVTIHAAAIDGWTGAMAYLESYSKAGETYDDINYTLRLRHPDGRSTSWEPETYNPYFGCRVQFLEWYGEAVIFIYREKHRTYLARIGFDSRPEFREIGHDWILDGRQLAYLGRGATEVGRVSIPQLAKLPPLSLLAAVKAELLPRT